MTSDGTSIRPAALDDLYTLAELNEVVQAMHVANRPDVFRPTEQNAVIQWFRACLGRPNVDLWIAEQQSKAVGYLVAVLHDRQDTAFSRARRTVEIDQIAVRPELQRRGIGRALMEHVFEDARSKGIRQVTIRSWAFNENSHAAFVALGFKPEIIEFSQTLRLE